MLKLSQQVIANILWKRENFGKIAPSNYMIPKIINKKWTSAQVLPKIVNKKEKFPPKLRITCGQYEVIWPQWIYNPKLMIPSLCLKTLTGVF